MLDSSQKTLLYLFENASYTTTQLIDLYPRDTLLCLDLTIDIEELDKNYWGREYKHGCQYKLHKI